MKPARSDGTRECERARSVFGGGDVGLNSRVSAHSAFAADQIVLTLGPKKALTSPVALSMIIAFTRTSRLLLTTAART